MKKYTFNDKNQAMPARILPVNEEAFAPQDHTTVTWLGNAGKNNKMFLAPMAFMIVVTICSLCLTVKNQIGLITAGTADWGAYAQSILGVLLIILAIVLVIEGIQTLAGKNKKAAA